MGLTPDEAVAGFESIENLPVIPFHDATYTTQTFLLSGTPRHPTANPFLNSHLQPPTTILFEDILFKLAIVFISSPPSHLVLSCLSRPFNNQRSVCKEAAVRM